MEFVMDHKRVALASLATAGALWGLTVPLSKLSLGWLSPGWLTVARFAVAAPLMAFAGRRGLRAALHLRVAAVGAIGFGAVVVLQNAGIARTSVSHASVVIGTVPILVALIAAGVQRAGRRPISWGGYGLALFGVALVAGSAGGGATVGGDLLVFASSVLSATAIFLQPELLAGRDPAAVTAVQFAAGGFVALPVALLAGGAPVAPQSPAPVLAFAALCVFGTLLPFWLFALGQSRVRAEIAGAFVNLEPLVGAAAGWLAFGEHATSAQLAGAAAVLAGLGFSMLPDRAPAPLPLLAQDGNLAVGERGRGRESGRRALASTVSRARARARGRARLLPRRSRRIAGAGVGRGRSRFLPAPRQRERRRPVRDL
jgi:drug/metabolite transporter (DMT)-like permease